MGAIRVLFHGKEHIGGQPKAQIGNQGGDSEQQGFRIYRTAYG